MKISIIIPTFNRQFELINAIKSVKCQSYPNWECIVIDDGSEDETESLIETYFERDERFYFYKRTIEPKGASSCRNLGAKIAKGDYLIFLDSDDLLLPNCLEKRIQKIHEFPDLDFLVIPMGIKKGEIIKQIIPYKENYLDDFLSYNLPWQTMCVLWNKHYFSKIGGFSENFPRLNDPELMIRAMLDNGCKYRVFNQCNYDSIYFPANFDIHIMLPKVYKSIELLIHEINKHSKKQKFNKQLIFNYVSYFVKNIYYPSNSVDFRKPLSLIVLSLKSRIISPLNFILSCLSILLITFFTLIKRLLIKLDFSNNPCK